MFSATIARMKYKLLAFDLDGTLLDRFGHVSAENRAAVALAQAAGLDVLFVTGRSWRSTQPIYAALGLTGPAICYLGALVVADGSGRILHHRPLVKEAWDAVRDLALAEGLAVTACMGADQAVLAGTLPGFNQIAADTAIANCAAPDFVGWADWNPYTQIHGTLAPGPALPTMAAVYGQRAVRRVLEAFPNGLPASQFDLGDKLAGEMVLHIWHEAVDKGTALADFCRSRAISPGEVVAFGDQMMDRPMFDVAGLGVAMPTGDPRLQAVADQIATPAQVIQLILGGKGGAGT
jgi:hydroxymethylpyrimidine pyrophosphatase-like HAD family hydrolase